MAPPFSLGKKYLKCLLCASAYQNFVLILHAFPVTKLPQLPEEILYILVMYLFIKLCAHGGELHMSVGDHGGQMRAFGSPGAGSCRWL